MQEEDMCGDESSSVVTARGPASTACPNCYFGRGHAIDCYFVAGVTESQ
jgi:hypothetical protein